MERFSILGAVAVCLTVNGCSKPEIPSDVWVTGVTVSNRDGTPMASPEVAVGDAVDAIVSFRPLEPNIPELEDRKVYDQEKWRLRAVILDESGKQPAPAAPGGLYGELHGFQMLGIESIPDPDAGQTLFGSATAVWYSPAPPEQIEEGKRYFWARTQVPQAPGNYRYLVQLHPTADPFFSGELNPEFGPPVTIFETSLVVTPGDPRDSRIHASVSLLDSPRERELRLKHQYSVRNP